jgi:hypothetical protein
MNDQKGIPTFERLEDLFRGRGVQRFFLKELAEKQDNEKNQIYLGSKGTDSIINAFPAELNYRNKSQSSSKRLSKKGVSIIEMNLRFYWLTAGGSCCAAPHTKIINYFQYPEARLSGFLKDCSNPPDALRRKKQEIYGKRYLALGSNAQGETYGVVVTERDDPIAKKMPSLKPSPIFPILMEHVIGENIGSSSLDLLKNELAAFGGKWHPSITLSQPNGSPIPFKGNQGAGYTLEALLNVPRNSVKAPDKHGFEIKSFKKGNKVSLMTPTADLGIEGEGTFREFMQTFGWSGQKHPDRLVFNGYYKYKKPKKTKRDHNLILDIIGPTDEPVVALMDCDTDQLVSGWSFNKLLAGWKTKHSSACYVEYEKRSYSGKTKDHDAEYLYTGRTLICEGTSIWNYLKAIAGQTVFYDPAHEILEDGKTKQRPQWRISVNKEFKGSLDSLYNRVIEQNII